MLTQQQTPKEEHHGTTTTYGAGKLAKRRLRQRQNGTKALEKKKNGSGTEVGIDLRGGRMFNKFGGGKSLCRSRAFCLRTVREKGNCFWK